MKKSKKSKGKTTLFNAIAGVLKPSAGEVDLCGKKVAYMFQEDRLFSDFTVLENVTCVTEEADSDIELSKTILKELGLENEIFSYPDDLSGGMCRRVALARTLVYNGDIVLLDEAFKGLDEENNGVIFTNWSDDAVWYPVTPGRSNMGIYWSNSSYGMSFTDNYVTYYHNLVHPSNPYEEWGDVTAANVRCQKE